MRGVFLVYFVTAVMLVSAGVATQVASWSVSFHDQLHGWSLNEGVLGRAALRVADASHSTESGGQFALDTAFSVFNLTLAGFLFWLRPRDRAAPLLAFALAGTAAVFNLQAYAAYQAIPPDRLDTISHDAFHAISAIAYVMAVVVFPDGHLVPRWRHWPRRLLYLGVAAAVFGFGFALRDSPRTALLVFMFGLVVPLVGFASQAYRYRRPATPADRQLSRLLAIALIPAVAIALWALSTGLADSADPAFEGRSIVVLPTSLYRVFQLVLSIVPLALLAGIFRYRLWSVDRLISRALVYSLLAGFVSAVYIGVVVGVGGLIGSRETGNLGLSVAATFLVATAFQPVKERTQRFANRLIYGKRATPYEVLSEFAAEVSTATAGEELLVRMAQVLAEGTAADRADVWLAVEGELRPAASWPRDPSRVPSPLPITGPQIPWINDVTTAVAVRHQGELFGALSVVKPPNEPLTPTEEKLMGDLGHQAGLALRNVRLTAELRARLDDLQASRQRIVAAGDDARRRLERNLHDGAQQELVAVKVQLAIAEDMVDELEGDTEPVIELLGKLKTQTGDALENLRDIARGIYPPLLAAEGLRTALTSQARKSPVEIRVDAADVGRYPQDVEACVYFCCLEAFQNLAKYSQATEAVVTLTEDEGGLRFVVEDNGVGFDISRMDLGAGCRNMSDRLEALGGSLVIDSAPGQGTRVIGWAPLAPATAPALTP